jgi:hypothetical protein
MAGALAVGELAASASAAGAKEPSAPSAEVGAGVSELDALDHALPSVLLIVGVVAQFSGGQ